MRVYANLINQNLALFDLPKLKYDQIKIFKQLLIYDQLPDDQFELVLEEAAQTARMNDPAFNILFNNDFEKYVSHNRHHAKWQKVKQDYQYYSQWEMKRRDKENPYHPISPGLISSWEDLPDLSKQKKNRPYQFDSLYRDAQMLSGEVIELTKNYKELGDKDLFRAKVNSILVPSKIVFALNNKENIQDFAQSEIMLVNIKISLDAYKLANVFIDRLINSLNKMKWSYNELRSSLDQSLKLAESLQKRIQERIFNMEKNFMLYLEADFEEEA